jgi:hypothetical protein
MNCIKWSGSDKVTYAVSGSHLDQEGIMAVTSRGFKEYGTSIFRS